MPKTIYIPEDARHSGIDITWTPSAGRLDIGGWYDTIFTEVVAGTAGDRVVYDCIRCDREVHSEPLSDTPNAEVSIEQQ